MNTFSSLLDELECFQGDSLATKDQYNGKKKENFRKYNLESSIAKFYEENHRNQTLDFVLQKKEKYQKLKQLQMGIWDAMKLLNQIKDDSDPDTSLSQIEHCFQVAEAARKDGHPRWFQLTCLIHDLGKILYFFGEPQWATVGTFIV